MGFFSFLGVLSPIHMICVKIFSGAKFIGQDSGGNKYYSAKPRKGYKQDRRWVMYHGLPDASKIPPEWHGWMHHQTDVVPSSDKKSFRRKWQKPHQQNLTGTDKAYHPTTHALKNGQSDNTMGNYEAWSPPE